MDGRELLPFALPSKDVDCEWLIAWDHSTFWRSIYRQPLSLRSPVRPDKPVLMQKSIARKGQACTWH